MAVTLAEVAMTAAESGATLLNVIANYFLRASDPLQRIGWATDKNLAVKITSWGALPSPGWRNLNADPSESTGTLEQKVESKYIMSQFIDCDRVLAKADPMARQLQREMTAEAMAFEFNDQFINGDPASKEFKGISKRVDDIYALGGKYLEQYFDAGSATTGRGLLYDTTDRQYFMDNIAKLIHVTAGNKPDVMYMNSKMYLAFEACLRRESMFNQTKDMFGRVINTYQDVPLVDIGLKADQSTEIITNGESLSGSGSSDETSIYAVKFGEGRYFWGIQQGPLEVIDQGLTNTKYRDLVEWVVGLAVSDPKSLTRAYGFVADNGAS